MKKLLFVFALLMGAVVVSSAQGVDEKGVEQKGKSRGKDANVKEAPGKAETNSKKGTTAVAPDNKSTEKSRGGYCTIYFENYTQWKIQCYVDGYYYGMVSGYGTNTVYVNPGSYSLYGVADFDDGSRLTWGPRSASCEGSYTWNLKY